MFHSPSRLFVVSGEMRTTSQLDFEAQTSFVLTVVASDGSHSAEADVTVSLRNVNEHAPVFERASFVIDASDLLPGDELVTVRATDLDRDSHVTFAFADPDVSRCVSGTHVLY